MTKILFIIPTMMTKARIPRLRECVSALRRQCWTCGVEGRIAVLCAASEEFFGLDIPGTEKVLLSDKYAQVMAINYGFRQRRDEDYICFIHDDMEVKDDKWITKFIEYAEDKSLGAGVLGLQAHKDSLLHDLGAEKGLEQHTWVDGVMFFKPDLLDEIGFFDERFTNDCSEQDFEFRAMQKGYKNYRVKVPFDHKQIPFLYKYDDDIFSRVKRSRVRFVEKWDGKTITIGDDHIYMTSAPKGWMRKLLAKVGMGDSK